jgi:hypothetical protein
VRFDTEGLPLPPPRSTLMPLVTGLILLAAAFLCGQVLIQELRTTAAVSTSPPPSATPSSPDSTDASLKAIASALQTMAAPTPTDTPRPDPTATYAMSTRTPPAYCGMGAGYDEECQWAAPTPTPIPPLEVCVTPTPLTCRWRGPMTPTPGAMPWPASVVR